MAVRKIKETKKSKASSSKAVSTKPAAPASAAAAVPPQRIAERAYGIWETSGCPHGFDQEHWFQAERELRSSRATT